MLLHHRLINNSQTTKDVTTKYLTSSVAPYPYDIRTVVIILTLVIHANAAGVEADVVLVFVPLVLHDVEERCVLHLQPEFAVLVFQHRFVLFLENTKSQFYAMDKVNVVNEKNKTNGCAFTVA